MSLTSILQDYAHRIRELRRANADVPETALAPAFQQLLEALLPLLPAEPGLIVVPEYRNPGVGRPDIALVRQGAPARAFVELKAPSKPSEPTRWRGQDQRQFERFKELLCWGTCNFFEFRLFNRDEELGAAVVVPERALRPDQTDARANRAIAEHDAGPFQRLIEMLVAGAGHEPVARDAEHLATLMAYSARLVRGIVRDRLAELHSEDNPRHALLQVRQEFRDVLYAHPEAAGYTATDFDALFSGAFAQTLAFGLLLVREGTGEPVTSDAWQHMPEEHPLMCTALRVLSLDEVVQDVGIGFEVMRDTVNCFTPEILVVPAGGRDPILYFYENFLQTFDPVARERFGVYYTPVEVVKYMVSALDRSVRGLAMKVCAIQQSRYLIRRLEPAHSCLVLQIACGRKRPRPERGWLRLPCKILHTECLASSFWSALTQSHIIVSIMRCVTLGGTMADSLNHSNCRASAFIWRTPWPSPVRRLRLDH